MKHTHTLRYTLTQILCSCQRCGALFWSYFQALKSLTFWSGLSHTDAEPDCQVATAFCHIPQWLQPGRHFLNYFCVTGLDRPFQLKIMHWGMHACSQLNKHAHIDCYATSDCKAAGLIFNRMKTEFTELQTSTNNYIWCVFKEDTKTPNVRPWWSK